MKQAFCWLSSYLKEQVHGKNFLYGEFLLAVLVVYLKAQVIGLIFFVVLVSVILVTCEDVMPTLLPFLLTCVFLSTMYNSYNTFIKIWWLGLPFIAAVLYHFIRYHRKITFGASFRGLVAVSVALILGGIGMISLKQYTNPISLYYMLGLGVGMILVYLLLRSQYGIDRDYDLMEMFAYVMYMVGFFACFVVLFKYSEKMDEFLETLEALELPSRNNYATFLMFAMPFPFYYAVKKKHHVFAGIFMYGCIILTGSRGGLLCGGVELLLCFVYLAYVDKEDRAFDVGMLCGLAVIGIMGYPAVLAFYESRCDDGDFFNDLGGRITMAKRAFAYLKQNPIFGSGIGYLGNEDIYMPKKGALCWYHSMPFQIIGSMGLVGVVAYGYMLLGRAKMILQNRQALPLAFGVSYIGILIMSCFNPGEFCPVPYEMLVVIYFVLLELHVEKMKKVACS